MTDHEETKRKLTEAHNNFPTIESHPALLYAEALNSIIELEAEVERLKDLLSCAHHELYDGKCKCKDCWSPGL